MPVFQTTVHELRLMLGIPHEESYADAPSSTHQISREQNIQTQQSKLQGPPFSSYEDYFNHSNFAQQPSNTESSRSASVSSTSSEQSSPSSTPFTRSSPISIPQSDGRSSSPSHHNEILASIAQTNFGKKTNQTSRRSSGKSKASRPDPFRPEDTIYPWISSPLFWQN